jgi:hypothetical protein
VDIEIWLALCLVNLDRVNEPRPLIFHALKARTLAYGPTNQATFIARDAFVRVETSRGMTQEEALIAANVIMSGSIGG